MKNKIILSIILLGFFASSVIAQDRPYRHLMTREYIQSLYSQNPNLERDMRIANKAVKKMALDLNELDAQYTIPITFYVVRTSAEDDISLSQIQSQIDALNRDFNSQVETVTEGNGIGARYEGMQANMNVEFCLSTENENSGIYYYDAVSMDWGLDDAIKSSAHGGIDRQSDDGSIPIWVGHLSDSTSGYSSVPGVDYARDGIVIDYRYFGWDETSDTPYNQGKTLTHLIGNYLGLYPLWGLRRCGSDYVMDTPGHNDPNYGCPSAPHISLCGHSEEENCFNFMDNTDDACMKMFTKGQKIRVKSILALEGIRHALISGTANCNASSVSGSVSSRSEKMNNINGSLNVYPNPTNRVFFFEVSFENRMDVEVNLFNTAGVSVKKKKYIQKKEIWDSMKCDDLIPGIYYLKVRASNQDYTQLITIQ